MNGRERRRGIADDQGDRGGRLGDFVDAVCPALREAARAIPALGHRGWRPVARRGEVAALADPVGQTADLAYY